MYCSRSFLSFQQSSQHFTKTRFHLKKTLSLLIHKKHLHSISPRLDFISKKHFLCSSIRNNFSSIHVLSCWVQSLSHVWLFVTPWTAVHQASLSIANSWSSLKFTSIESVMPSNHLILCCPLLLLPSIFRSIRVFSNELALRIRWPKYWSFSFSINPSKEHPGLISLGWTGWISLQSKGLSRVFSNTTVQKPSILRRSAFFIVQLSHPYMTTGKTIFLTRWTFVGKVMSLLFNILSRLVITFLPRSKYLLRSQQFNYMFRSHF